MKVRTSLSVINFKEKVEKIWNLKPWEGIEDEDKDVLFFGLYTPHDYDAWYFSPDDTKRTVFWCGSDILNTIHTPEFIRRLKLCPDAKHYCETQEEYLNLKSIGIEAEIVPSFLEDVNDFKITYKQSKTPHIWMCAHPGREKEYGVDLAIKMAQKFPEYTFHVYGMCEWNEMDKPKNVWYHGNIDNNLLNEEIKEYQCGLRCNGHEGLSEVPVKAILNGQYAITYMKFPSIWNFQTEEELENLLKKLPEMETPNNEGLEYWKNNINKFPWMKK
jgi:hypothetical protein